jgi:hypothetical protein
MMKMMGSVLLTAVIPVLALAAGIANAASPTCDRACLIKLTDDYLAALAKHDPKAVPLAANLPPRAPSYPNISRECKGQLDSHAMDNMPYAVTLKDGSKGVRTAESVGRGPFDLPAAHIFKVGADGKVHEIEAMGFLADYKAPTGWEK